MFYTEGLTEEIQERELLRRGRHLGQGNSEAEKSARLHESFIGGMLLGGSMNAGFSLASKVRPQDLSKRPADPSFGEGQRIDSELARIPR